MVTRGAPSSIPALAEVRRMGVLMSHEESATIDGEAAHQAWNALDQVGTRRPTSPSSTMANACLRFVVGTVSNGQPVTPVACS